MEIDRMAKLCYLIDTNYNEWYKTGKAVSGLEYIKSDKGLDTRLCYDAKKPPLSVIIFDVLEKYGDMKDKELDAIIAKDTPYRATPVGEKISMNLVFYREENMIYNPENKEGNTSRSSSE